MTLTLFLLIVRFSESASSILPILYALLGNFLLQIKTTALKFVFVRYANLYALFYAYTTFTLLLAFVLGITCVSP